MKTPVLPALAAVLALVATAPSQTVTGTPVSLSGPPTYVGVYDVASGTFLPGATPPPGTTVVYDNSLSVGSFFPAGPDIVNMDWGVLSAGGNNDIVSFEMGYATSDTNPVDMRVYLHEGATGFGDPGAEVTAFDITGLPGSASGDPEGFIVTVDISGSPVNLADGPIGYSYEAFDTVTGPLLVDPPPALGVEDAFDQYTSLLGAYIGTFFFGGDPFASFYMVLEGTEPECYLVAGDGPGDSAFQPGSFQFQTKVNEVEDFYPVLMDDYPSFQIPDVPAIAQGVGPGQTTNVDPGVPAWIADDMQFVVELMMYNPGQVPDLPEQYSQAVWVRVMPDGTIAYRKFGPGTIDVEVDVDTDAEGNKLVSFPFSVPGF